VAAAGGRHLNRVTVARARPTRSEAGQPPKSGRAPQTPDRTSVGQPADRVCTKDLYSAVATSFTSRRADGDTSACGHLRPNPDVDAQGNPGAWPGSLPVRSASLPPRFSRLLYELRRITGHAAQYGRYVFVLALVLALAKYRHCRRIKVLIKPIRIYFVRLKLIDDIGDAYYSLDFVDSEHNGMSRMGSRHYLHAVI